MAVPTTCDSGPFRGQRCRLGVKHGEQLDPLAVGGCQTADQMRVDSAEHPSWTVRPRGIFAWRRTQSESLLSPRDTTFSVMQSATIKERFSGDIAERGNQPPRPGW